MHPPVGTLTGRYSQHNKFALLLWGGSEHHGLGGKRQRSHVKYSSRKDGAGNVACRSDVRERRPRISLNIRQLCPPGGGDVATLVRRYETSVGTRTHPSVYIYMYFEVYIYSMDPPRAIDTLLLQIDRSSVPLRSSRSQPTVSLEGLKRAYNLYCMDPSTGKNACSEHKP